MFAFLTKEEGELVLIDVVTQGKVLVTNGLFGAWKVQPLSRFY
jgi:hypothetical protein